MNTIDKLGYIKSQIAELVRQEAELKADLKKKLGYGTFSGQMYDLTIFQQERGYLDQDAVKRKLSPQFLRAHTTYKQVDVVKLTARQREVA